MKGRILQVCIGILLFLVDNTHIKLVWFCSQALHEYYKFLNA
jgi:hypothetical protein